MREHKRIYKPGGAAAAHSGHSGSGAGHPGDEPEAKPFPLHCLPPSVAAMARAIANTERTPASLAGCCTLGILSASIGASLRVRSGPDRFTRGNIYLLASAESGSGKSETFRHAARPFTDFEDELIKQWKASVLPGLAAEKDILEVEIGKLRKLIASDKSGGNRDEIKARLEQKKAALAQVDASMIAPVFSVEDVTTERLAVLLGERGETLASMSPDAGAIVNNLLGRYSKLDRTDEGIYLKAYSGDYCRVDRMGRAPVLLNAPCLSVLWLVQPDKVETLLGERSLTDGGLIPRILICHTRAEALHIIEHAPGIPPEVSAAYRETIRGLLKTYRLASEARTIKADSEALAALVAYHNGTVDRRNADLQDVKPFAARWGEQAWRLAVCIHAGSYGREAHEVPLELATANAAIELADWFAAQQLEILSAGRYKARRKIRDDVLALLVDSPKGIRASDVYRARITRDAEAAHTLLATMEAEGELTGRDEKPERGGHVTRLYTRARK